MCLLIVFVVTGGLLTTLGCAGRRTASPTFTTAPTTTELLAALRATGPTADTYLAELFLTFSGGFLEEDRLKINGQMALEAPDQLRMIGAYGAFKKVFDLRVSGDRFQVFDNRAAILYRGGAFDPEAAGVLGFAVRPGDIPRLLRLGGAGPLEGADLGDVHLEGDSIRVVFQVPGDPATWLAGYDVSTLQLRSLARWLDDHIELQVAYDRFSEQDGQQVPERVRVSRPTSDERVDIDVRSIRVKSDLSDSYFEFKVPDGATVRDL